MAVYRFPFTPLFQLAGTPGRSFGVWGSLRIQSLLGLGFRAGPPILHASCLGLDLSFSGLLLFGASGRCLAPKAVIDVVGGSWVVRSGVISKVAI